MKKLQSMLLFLACVCTSAFAQSTTSSIPQNGQVNDFDGIEMVYVEGMNDGFTNIGSFYIGKYEVTQAQWQKIMRKNPSQFHGKNRPVECVTWSECQKFIKKLNKATGRTYRLPTAAEWEYAAQGGKAQDVYKYAGSAIVAEVAWYADNAEETTHKVGEKQPNSLGIYDMSGNVWEWCADCSDEACAYRVHRGGSWFEQASTCGVAIRGASTVRYWGGDLGLRLVLVP